MIKLSDLISERIDYDQVANYLVKYYKLKSKVKIGGAKHDYGDYIPEKDLILLKRSYPNVKEFVISVLHEIKHALDADRLGVKKFVKKYNQAGTMAVHQGKDPHDDNKWEELAEKWAQREYKRKWSKKF
tara:strand:+ start:811 stop:1197 length:387 start_codon:yes stop_codon:yes gene_type:complete